MQISKRSWHYRLLEFWSNQGHREHFVYNVSGFPPRDICSYMRSLIWMLTWLTILGAWPLAYIRGWYLMIHAWVTTGKQFVGSGLLDIITMIYWAIGNMCLVLLIIALSIAGIFFLKGKWEDYRESRGLSPCITPTIAKTWWRSVKDKTCIILETKE